MKLEIKDPPREFNPYADVILKDCAHITLEPYEQVTFTTADGKNNDFTAHDWGYYATNSINYRLLEEGLKTALVKSTAGEGDPRLFINIVKKEKIDDFLTYLKTNESQLVCWLDEWFSSAKEREVR